LICGSSCSVRAGQQKNRSFALQRMEWQDAADILAVHVRRCLGNAGVVPLLRASHASLASFLTAGGRPLQHRIRAWLLRARVSLRPMLQGRLRLPGFCTAGVPLCLEALPPDVSCWARPRSHPCLEAFTELEMDAWLDDVGMGGLTPVEAVLALNAWPRASREDGERLSDFLQAAQAQFFYDSRVNAPHDRWLPSLVILFRYHDFEGIVWAGAVAEQLRRRHRRRRRRAASAFAAPASGPELSSLNREQGR
jgi:hypothetical protein